MSSRLFNRLQGRVYGWFDSKEARPVTAAAPVKFSARSRLALTNLEDRCVPATFTVTLDTDNLAATANDGSLRGAILAANADIVADTIVFNATTFGTAKSIVLLGELPNITNPVTLTGTTSGSTNLVTIDGNNAFRAQNTGGAATGAVINVNKLNFFQCGDIVVPGNGGAFVVGDEKVTFANCTFNKNTGLEGGAIIIIAGGAVTIQDSILTGNTATAATPANYILGGGGVRMASATASLTVTNSYFGGNNARFGGGILSTAGTLNISGSTFKGNVATQRGGGIQNFGATSTMTLSSSILTGNSATVIGAALYFNQSTNTITNTSIIGNTSTNSGTGLYAFGSNKIEFVGCTISGNSSGNGGGGLQFGAPTTTLNIINTTIANNTSAGSGAGIRGFNLGASLNIFNSTITGNSSNSTSTVQGNGGGGLTVSTAVSPYTPTTINISGSIISGNTQSTGVAGKFNDISFAAMTSGPSPAANTFNVTNSAIGVSDGHTPVLTFSSLPTPGNNLDYGTALALGVLGDNGGVTAGSTLGLVPQQKNFTRSIGAGSPAVDKGSNMSTPPQTTDGRGPGFAREVPTGLPDIGAFEFAPAGVPTAAVGPLVAVHANITSGPNQNNPYSFSVTYNIASPSTIDNTTIDTSDIIITGPGGPITLASAVAAPNSPAQTVVGNYTFLPPGGSWDTGDVGVYSVVLQKNQVKASNNAFVGNGSTATLGSISVTFPTTFTVLNDNDTGAGSLRAAITAANTSTDTADTIVFDPAFFTSAKTILLGSALPSVSDAVTITAPLVSGASVLTIDGAGLFRPFNLSPAVSGSNITISNATIANSSAPGAGGAIFSDNENVTLNNVIISNAQAAAGVSSGGAIRFGGVGTLELNNSKIINSTAGAQGGAITIGVGTAAVRIINSTISGNSAVQNGGGIYFAAGGSLLVSGSTISGNTATGAVGGGGIYFFGTISAPGFEIRNSTISGNSSSAPGGGLGLYQASGTVNLLNSTITGNTGSVGGGFRGYASALTVNVTSSIISGNFDTVAAADDFYLDTLDGAAVATFSAIGKDSAVTSGLNYSSVTNIPFNTALNLGPLADNNYAMSGANPVLTHLPGTGSVLLNAGSNPAPALTTDTRNFARVVGSQIDIGSVERQPFDGAPVAFNGTFTTNAVGGAAGAPTDGQQSRIYNLEVFFSGTVAAANFNTLGAITLTRTAVSSIPTGIVGDVVQTGPAANNHITVTQGAANSLILTFDNNGSFTATAIGVESGSLSDGYWQLTIGSVSTPLNALGLRRLFGDSTISAGGLIDGSDGVALGNAFNSASLAYDFDNSGTVDGGDNLAFGNRFGNVL